MGSPNLSLDPSWPGLRAPSGRIEADPDEMEAVAAELRDEAGELRSLGIGSLDQLRSGSRVSTHSFGGWWTAQQVGNSYHQAHQAVVQYVEMMVSTLERAAEQLEQTAKAIREGDTTNAAGFRSGAAELGNQQQSGGSSVTVA